MYKWISLIEDEPVLIRLGHDHLSFCHHLAHSLFDKNKTSIILKTQMNRFKSIVLLNLNTQDYVDTRYSLGSSWKHRFLWGQLHLTGNAKNVNNFFINLPWHLKGNLSTSGLTISSLQGARIIFEIALFSRVKTSILELTSSYNLFFWFVDPKVS